MLFNRTTNVTRRSALLAAAAASIAVPTMALADTKADLSSAKARLEAAQAELDAIASEYEELSAQQSVTLDQLNETEKQVAKVKKNLKRIEKELSGKQSVLAQNVSDEYKEGSRGIVDLLLRSSSVEELISNVYYYGKITEEQATLIEDVKSTRARYNDQMFELEIQQASLEEVSKEQADQLASMQDKQLEAQQLIAGLDKEVRKLIAKRDAELLAAQKEAEAARVQREEAARKAAEEEAARKAAEEEAAKQEAERQEAANQEAARQSEAAARRTEEEQKAQEDQSAATVEEESPVDVEDEVEEDVYEPEGGSTGSAASVIASCMSTPSPGLGLCAGWCSNVMINAGYGFVPGNANDMYANYCHSSSRSDLRPGMAVAVSTHPHTSAGRIYGHIGMYVGNGTVMDNVGFIRTISLDEWCSFYGQTVPVRWGWLNNIVLS